MASLNLCQFIGNVGNIETRYLPNGDAVTNMSLAVNSNYKTKDGEKVEKTEWVRVTFYRKLAEIAGEYLKKGSMAYVEGRLETRKWEDKNGVEKYTTEIIANSMQMLSGKSGEPTPRNDATAENKPAAKNACEPGSFDDFEDDIPF